MNRIAVWRKQWIGGREVYPAVGLVIAITLIAIAGAAKVPLNAPRAVVGGVFWQLPLPAWMAAACLIALSLFLRTHAIRLVAIVAFGVVSLGILGFIEPLGVFHDSWRNIGLGQLTTSATQVEAARQVAYVESTPASFLLFGLLRGAFPDTASFLRVYPLLMLLLYGAGVYAMADAFYSAHEATLFVERSLFAQMSVFSFVALSSLFWVRVNPAPQSLAFALMPFCLASLINGIVDLRFLITAFVTFGVVVFTHPITAAMIITVGGAWTTLDWLRRRRSPKAPRLVMANSVILYACLFATWLIYVGAWMILTGDLYAERFLNVLDSGQRAAVIATPTQALLVFIWIHRAALAGGALLVATGVGMTLAMKQVAAARLLLWFATAGAWLPFFLLGEFADRGPLFALLPAALAVGFALSTDRFHNLRKWARLTMCLTAFASYITAYSNHIGEVITKSEITAFATIGPRLGEGIMLYGYTPPLTDEAVLLYSSDQVRAHAFGAADFEYERLLSPTSAIVISEQMREAAESRGPEALAELQLFEDRLLQNERYRLIFDNGSVRMYRAP